MGKKPWILCCIPLVLGFCCSPWLVNLVLARMFLLIFWGRGLLQWFSNVFARGGLALPLPGVGLNNLLRFALRSFCSLQAFLTASEEKSENGSLPISTPEEPRTRGPAPQCAPREKQSIPPVSGCTPCSPGLWLSIFISGTRPHVESPNPADPCGALPVSYTHLTLPTKA